MGFRSHNLGSVNSLPPYYHLSVEKLKKISRINFVLVMPSPVAKDSVAFVLGLEAAFDIFNKIY